MNPPAPGDHQHACQACLSKARGERCREAVGLCDGYREAGFEAGIRAALEAILVDPEFLFRIERDPGHRTRDGLSPERAGGGVAAVVLPVEQPPDDELIALADRGALSIRLCSRHRCAGCSRIGARTRSSRISANSGCRSAGCRSDAHVNAFPEFDDNLRQAFQRETRLFSRASCGKTTS